MKRTRKRTLLMVLLLLTGGAIINVAAQPTRFPEPKDQTRVPTNPKDDGAIAFYCLVIPMAVAISALAIVHLVRRKIKIRQ